MSNYPGMSARESGIWAQFLRDVTLPPGEIYYNARIGRPIPGEPGWAPWVYAVREATSRKRLDAVLRKPNAWWLFEVKVRAGLSSIGQAIGYEYLFNQAILGTAPVLVVVVCEYVSRDVDEILAHEGIGMYIVHPIDRPRWTPPALAGLVR